MKVLERKQKIRHIIYSIPLLIILSVISVFLIKGVLGVMSKEVESRKDLRNLEEKVDVLVAREAELKEGIRRLETENGIKDEIRERFNVTQEGEFVAVIVDDRRTASSTGDSMMPWYRIFWNAIMSFYE